VHRHALRGAAHDDDGLLRPTTSPRPAACSSAASQKKGSGSPWSHASVPLA
jgi:hypothetical protein